MTALASSKDIRAQMGMSQAEFASAFGFNLKTLQDWEQGRSAPRGAAMQFLKVIRSAPDVVRNALRGYPEPPDYKPKRK